METSINENVLKTDINKICRTCFKLSQKVLQPIHSANQNTVFMLTNLNILEVRNIRIKHYYQLHYQSKIVSFFDTNPSVLERDFTTVYYYSI